MTPRSVEPPLRVSEAVLASVRRLSGAGGGQAAGGESGDGVSVDVSEILWGSVMSGSVVRTKKLGKVFRDDETLRVVVSDLLDQTEVLKNLQLVV